MCSRAHIMTRTHVEGIICSRDKRVPWVIHVESWLDDRKWSLTLNGSTTSILVKTSGNWLSVRAHRFCTIVCVSESSTIVFAIRNYHIANALSRVNSRSCEISFDNVMKKLVTVLSTGPKTLSLKTKILNLVNCKLRTNKVEIKNARNKRWSVYGFKYVVFIHCVYTLCHSPWQMSFNVHRTRNKLVRK